MEPKRLPDLRALTAAAGLLVGLAWTSAAGGRLLVNVHRRKPLCRAHHPDRRLGLPAQLAAVPKLQF